MVFIIFGLAAETENTAETRHMTKSIPNGMANKSLEINSAPLMVNPEPNKVMIIPIIRVSILMIIPALLSAMAM